MNYHDPVLLQECIEGLNIKPDGTYVDVTFGGGGHSREILKHLNENGRLFAFDQDPDAHANAIDDPRFTLIKQNFQHLKKGLRLHQVTEIDGLLGDLGVSSHQFDEPDRGFSWRFEGPLDMRMNPAKAVTAAQIINEFEEEEISNILYTYGEIRNARQVARRICNRRAEGKIETTSQLVKILDPMAPKKGPTFFAQVFQALRIEVNAEIKALEELLTQSLEVLKTEGRLVIISYHSLEDRLVKNFIREGKLKGEADRDFYGNRLTPLENISRKAIKPSEEEIEKNSRARSARLRIAAKK